MIKIKNVKIKHLKECLNALVEDANISITEGSLLDNYKFYKNDINFNIKNEFIDFLKSIKKKYDTIEFKEIYVNSWLSKYEVILN